MTARPSLASLIQTGSQMVAIMGLCRLEKK